MSVIAWDGKSLAADRYADMCGANGIAEKLFLLPTNEVVGFTGALSTGNARAIMSIPVYTQSLIAPSANAWKDWILRDC